MSPQVLSLCLLQALPRLTPDPRWKAAAKHRLLLAYDRWYAGMSALRHWAVYVSSRTDASDVANAIVARGQSWRPVVVTPERASEAVRVLRPVLVIIEGQLPGSRQLLEDVRRGTGITAVTDDELLNQAA